MTAQLAPLARHALVCVCGVSLREAALVSAAAIACLALRRQSATLRHAIWCAVLAAVVLMPLALQVGPRWRIELPHMAAHSVRETIVTTASRPVARVAAAEASRPARLGAGALPDLLAVAGLAWLAVAAWLLARLLASHVRLATLVRRSRPLRDPRWIGPMTDVARTLGIGRAIPLSVSGTIALPIVAGFVHPRVVLPRDCDEWNAETRHAILLHELAHVRRSDLAWLTLGRVVTAVFWFHPFVRYACARQRIEAEQACDDAVLRGGHRASDYASLLLAMASTCPPPTPAAGLAVLAREHLRERIEAIIAAERCRHVAGGRAIATIAACACFVTITAASPRLDGSQPAAPGARDRHPAAVRGWARVPVRVLGATVRTRPLAHDEVRIDAPAIEVENTADRTIRFLEVRLFTPGVSEDLVWRMQRIGPGERTVVAIPADHWSQVVPRARAASFEIGIEAVRFTGEPERAAVAPTPGPSRDTGSDGSHGPSVDARVLNPPGAPIVITEAWTPRDPLPPSAWESDRHHDLTWMPGIVLRNVSEHRAVAMRLRFKADAESHAVTVVNEPIAPGRMLRVEPRPSMWGTPDAMTAQILGVQFDDGSVWGTLDSTIDTRQGWIR